MLRDLVTPYNRIGIWQNSVDCKAAHRPTVPRNHPHYPSVRIRFTVVGVRSFHITIYLASLQLELQAPSELQTPPRWLQTDLTPAVVLPVALTLLCLLKIPSLAEPRGNCLRKKKRQQQLYVFKNEQKQQFSGIQGLLNLLNDD